LKSLASASRTSPLDERWTRLSSVLDTDRFARYLAMQVLTANWDGYALYQNNYRVYHDPGSDRLVFMPHGMDQTFAHTFMPLMPPRWIGSVAQSFMETAGGRALYVQYAGALFTNTYHAEALAKRVDELAARVRPVLAEQSERMAMTHDRLVAELRSRILQRGEFLERQLANTNWMMLPRRRPIN
jgi:hypothetical protein